MCHRLSHIYQSKGSHRMIDVLEVLLTQISELYIHLASDLIVGSSRDANAARLCNALKPRRDVDAVPEDIMWFDDHVADVDADAESNSSVFCLTGCEFFDACLELQSGANRFDRAWKLRQEPVAGVLYDAATMFRDRRRNLIREERSQFGMRGLFVMMHE